MAGPSKKIDTAGSCQISWIRNFYNDDEADEQEEMVRSVKLLRTDGRRFIYWICCILKTYVSGIPAQSVHIVERFLASYLRLDDSVSLGELEERKQTLATKLPLIVAVCVWLATKMNSASEPRLNAVIICMRLRQYDVHCTIKDLISLEIDVYKRINYRIPLWSTIEKANMLAVVVGYTGAIFKCVVHLMNIAELLRDEVQKYVIMIANKPSPNEGTSSTPIGLRNIRNGHYCAAVVLAVASLTDYKGPNPDTVTQHLAKLTKSSPIYLKSIADAIVHKINIFGMNPILPYDPSHYIKRKYKTVGEQSKRPRL